MFRKFDVIFLSFFSCFMFLRTLMYQFFAAIGRVAALRRESQLNPTHFCWKNTYVFTHFFSWIFQKCMDALWGACWALVAHLGGSGADNWSQKRVLVFIISSFLMKLYMCVHLLMHVHRYCVIKVCRWVHARWNYMCEVVFMRIHICIYAYMHVYIYA